MHEGTIDLDRIEGEALQIGKRGIAGAEIVEAETGAEFVDAGQNCAAYSGFSMTRPSVNSSFSVPRAIFQRERTAHILQQIVTQQLPG